MKKRILLFWPIVVILIIWSIFASPYLFQKKVPFPSDYLVANFGPWNSYQEYAGPVKNSATPDVITQIFPWKKLVIDSWKSGEVPLWNPYLFAGTPLLANYQSSALSPFNLIFLILPFIDAWSILVILQPLLAGIFMYLFVRSLKLSQVASLVSSIAFMFCGFLTTWGVYGELGYAILFLPLALYGIEKFYEDQKWYFSLLISLCIPLSFFSGHFQTSLYFLGLTIAYSLFKFTQTKNIKFFICNLLSVFLGLLICMPQLLPSMEFYKESVRSLIFQKTEAIPLNYLPTLIAPDFFGNPITGNNWFGHYAEWNAYIGLVPLMLAFYSLKKRSSYVIFFALCAVVSFLLAFNSPILDLLIAARVPVLSTSAASRIIVLFSFSSAILAAYGFEYLVIDIKQKKYKYITFWILSFLIIFGFLMFAAITKLFIQEDKASIVFSNLRLPTIIFSVFAFLIVVTRFVKHKKVILVFSTIVILLAAFELLRFSTKWQSFEPRNFVYPENQLSRFLIKTYNYDREFGNFDQSASMLYNTPSLEGYDPLYIQKYGEFIAAAADGLYHVPERSGVTLSKNGEYTGKIINFLGVKHIIHKVADGQQVWAFPFWQYPVDQFRSVYKDDKYLVLANDKVLPRAFIVGKVEVENNAKKIINKIFKNDLDLSNVAVVESKLAQPISDLATGSANIENFESNTIKVNVNSNETGFLVLTDPYYPGWNAYVDGKLSKIYRTDYAFRGVIVPKGEHTIVFKYEPESFRNGIILAVIGLIGTIFMSGYLLMTNSRRK